MSSMPPVIVIGGGIIGVCAAAWLQREGRDVLLVDHGDPGMGASFGHGHVGMCGAPTTGKIVSDLVCGRAPSIDLKPFSARRF